MKLSGSYKMDKVKILVACHKPAKVYQDDVYTPIQVGKALHPDLELGYITDATGDNISSKNGNYSELTAQYWAWKNLHDVEYIGLCHYRRYFLHRITNKNVDSILGNNADIVLVNPLIEWMNLGERLYMFTSREDVYIFYKCFGIVHPNELNSFLRFLSQNRFSPFNMFVMRKKEFDKFAKWQFDIFFEMEKYVRISGYARQKRVYGYLSEILLSFYSYSKGLKETYDLVADENGQNVQKSRLFRTYVGIKNNISFNLSHGVFAHNKKLFSAGYAVETGMKQDNILI